MPFELIDPEEMRCQQDNCDHEFEADLYNRKMNICIHCEMLRPKARGKTDGV